MVRGDGQAVPLVLLGLGGGRAGDVARAFADQGSAPLMAFTSDQLFAFGEFADVIVADDELDPGAAALRRAGGSRRVPRLFLSESSALPPIEVHAVVRPDLGTRELIERAHALLALRDDAAVPGSLSFGGVSLDVARREARVFGDPVELTRAQFDILAILVRAGGSVVSKDDLQRGVWPDAPVDDGQRLLAHVRRIRARIEPNPSRPTVLLTARGVGFRIGDRPESGSTNRRRAHLRVADAPD